MSVPTFDLTDLNMQNFMVILISDLPPLDLTPEKKPYDSILLFLPELFAILNGAQVRLGVA